MEVKHQHSKKEDDGGMVLSQASSRIFRVSRASGGKDRHSKVFTSKGLRDRRVRLSVSTAIQFYDLQDRLGFDQPSKAIEWLIKAASSAISQLPSLVSSFPELAEGTKTNAAEACSSTSETSKGSVLSLSRSEIRIKARERARLRAAKDKEEKHHHPHHHDHANQSSFTELLSNETVTADYFGQGGFFSRTDDQDQLPSSFCSAKGQIFSSSSSPAGMMMMPYNNIPEMQQSFSFVNEQHMDYNLNFSIAPGLAGFHRGTLQSNPSAQLPFSPSSNTTSSSMDVHNLPFFHGAEAHFHSLFDSRLQSSREQTTRFCLDGYRPSDLKGKRKS